MVYDGRSEAFLFSATFALNKKDDYSRNVIEFSARARMWAACVSRLRAMRCVTAMKISTAREIGD